jgi:hypothetical protein
MTKKKPERRSPKEGQRSSELDHCLGGTSCAQPAKVNADDLVLCERHALEAKLEGQISCWEGILFHIDLWSREAARRDREDVVRLLEGSARAGSRCQAQSLRRSRSSQERDALEKHTAV